MIYNNPDDAWMKHLSKEYKSGCFQVSAILTGFLIVMAICALCSCSTTKYVPVQQKHTEHHLHTDTVKERDSIHTENMTIIREVDSAAMAKYGIQMESNQVAWLILQREMEQKLQELEHMTANRDTVHDSIPVPYPVETVKEVAAELSWWQNLRIWIGNVALMIFAAFVCYLGWRAWKVYKEF